MTPIDQLTLELDTERRRHQETQLALRRLLEEGFTERQPEQYDIEVEVADDGDGTFIATASCLDGVNVLILEGWRALAAAEAEDETQ